MPRAFRIGRHRKNEIRWKRAQAGGVPLTVAEEPVPLLEVSLLLALYQGAPASTIAKENELFSLCVYIFLVCIVIIGSHVYLFVSCL